MLNVNLLINSESGSIDWTIRIVEIRTDPHRSGLIRIASIDLSRAGGGGDQSTAVAAIDLSKGAAAGDDLELSQSQCFAGTVFWSSP